MQHELTLLMNAEVLHNFKNCNIFKNRSKYFEQIKRPQKENRITH